MLVQRAFHRCILPWAGYILTDDSGLPKRAFWGSQFLSEECQYAQYRDIHLLRSLQLDLSLFALID